MTTMTEYSVASFPVQVGEWRSIQGSYVCRFIVIPEEDGGFSVHATELPGVVSEGDTVEEAIENIKDAFRESILSYKEAGESIPWAPVEIGRTDETDERWILVDA